LFGKIGDEDIQPAVAVEISELSSHSGPGISVRVIANAGAVGQISERPVSVIPVQEVPRQIVGDEDVRPSVIIEIAESDAQPLAGRVGDTRFPGNIREGTVAVISIEQIWRAVKTARVAIHAVSRLLVTAVDVFFQVVIKIPNDIEVQLTVA